MLGHRSWSEASPPCCPCRDIASNRRELLQLRITHVLNASHCRWRGGAEYYEGTGIRYLGIEAHDSPSFDMSPYFYPAADFIHQALNEGPWGRFWERRGWKDGGNCPGKWGAGVVSCG